MKSSRSAAIISAADRVSKFTDFCLCPVPNIAVCFTPKLAAEEWGQYFHLTKRNMEATYNSSGDPEWAWDDSRKQKEILNSKSRFINLYSPGSQLVGFACFRFLIDGGRPVLYVWELQIHASFQGKGLGQFLMSQVERFASMTSPGITCILLTCLRNNIPALTFYEKLGYVSDISNPETSRGTCYVILAKKLN